ncbi:ATP-binding protein [Flavisolibacter ginsenosidimutans]|nr:ATP-binding protein [Flavisolibacter ginsenosidimutans]
MNSLKSKTGRIVFSVSTLCLFLLAMIWVSYCRQRSFDKSDTIRFAIERNSNLAVALEQYVIRTLHNADAVLQVVKMEYADKGESLDLKNLLKRISISQDIDDCVSIIGPDGRLKMANVAFPGHAAADFSDQPYFIFHSQNNSDSLLISEPRVSRASGKPVIVISRRLYDEKGGFAGVVTLEIQPSVFTSFYAQAHPLQNDIISLIAPDGMTYARRTGDVESSGEDVHKSPLFRHVAQCADSFYFAPDAIRHIPTWFSYRKLNDYAIIATVGSSEANILVDFTNRQPRFIIPRVIISLFIVLFSLFGAQFLLRRRKLADRLLAEEEKYRRLLTQQMVAVQEREREWIGRELHDNVNQVLTTVKLYLEIAAREEGSPLIPRSMQLVNRSITEIRNLSHQLSAPTLGTGSLVDSINALIETVAFSNHLQFAFDYSGYTGVVMSQKLALYRILQEQLTNIVKHAQATHVWISLFGKDDNVILTVRDNGKGFDATSKTRGMGITNIISRAKVFDGTVQIETAPQNGCLLTVTMSRQVVEERSVH